MGAKRNSGNSDGKQKYRFFKSHLPAIVWNPNGKAKMADFSKGHFTTDDIEVAQLLLDKGYPQIPVDATEPPDIVMAIPGQSLEEGEMVPMVGENERSQPKPTLVPMPHE